MSLNNRTSRLACCTMSKWSTSSESIIATNEALEGWTKMVSCWPEQVNSHNPHNHCWNMIKKHAHKSSKSHITIWQHNPPGSERHSAGASVITNKVVHWKRNTTRAKQQAKNIKTTTTMSGNTCVTRLTKIMSKQDKRWNTHHHHQTNQRHVRPTFDWCVRIAHVKS